MGVVLSVRRSCVRLVGWSLDGSVNGQVDRLSYTLLGLLGGPVG